MRRASKNVAAVPPPLVQVSEEASKSLIDVLEVKTSVPGIAVSFLLHAVILFILTLFAVVSQLDSEAPLLGTWLVDTKTSEKELPKEIRKPVKVLSMPKVTPKTEVKTTPKVSEGEKVVRPIQPVPVEKSLAGRTERAKAGALDSVGSKDAIKRAVDSGIAWVVRQQRAGGNWQLHSEGQYPDPGSRTFRTDTGATALALLALLGDGHTHRTGKYQEQVAKGLRWLRSAQKVDGDFHDHTEMGRQSSFYAHSQAVIAICEAITLSGDETFRECAEAGVQYLLDSQHPTQGGWKYMPQDEDSMGDLSVTGWCLMALHTARMAGVDVPDEAFSRASFFMDQVADSSGAHYRYQPSDHETKFTPALTAVGLLGRQWLGWQKDDIAMKQGVKYLLDEKNKPEWAPGKRNVYEWYYSAQVLHNIGGAEWKTWYSGLQTQIVEAQKRRGSRKAPDDVQGSWDPVSPYGANAEYSREAGRLYLTALSLLILETPYRHYPIYDAE